MDDTTSVIIYFLIEAKNINHLISYQRHTKHQFHASSRLTFYEILIIFRPMMHSKMQVITLD